MSAKQQRFVILRRPVAGHIKPAHRFMCGAGSWAPDLGKALQFKSHSLAEAALHGRDGEVIEKSEAVKLLTAP